MMRCSSEDSFIVRRNTRLEVIHRYITYQPNKDLKIAKPFSIEIQLLPVLIIASIYLLLLLLYL